MMPALPRFFLAIVLTVPRAARGQEVFGIVRGTVSDSTGALVSAARVSLLGTAFTAVTREDGRYAIEYVPAGRYTIRAELGEYASTERPGVVVPAGAAVRLDMRLGATAPGGRPPLAPAAEPTSRTRVAGDVLRDLPVDDPRQALTLSPATTASGMAGGSRRLQRLSRRIRRGIRRRRPTTRRTSTRSSGCSLPSRLRVQCRHACARRTGCQTEPPSGSPTAG